MTNKNNGNDSENKSILSINARGGFFEIRVKGHLAEESNAKQEGAMAE
jgi:hypothetical protein